MNATTKTEVAAIAAPPAEPTVLLWSRSQNVLHIEPLSRMLDKNRRAYVADRRMDYVPMFIGSDDDCHAAAASMRQTLIKRQDQREAAKGKPL